MLHPASLADPAAAAVLLRHALELALWQRLGGAGAHHACHVAARYLAGLAAPERARARAALPPKLLAAYDAPAAPPLPQLAAPAEPLLVQGGGSRLHLDPESARNPYGCAARPQPEVLAFASSTASAISAPALREVEALRRSLLRAGLAGELPAALAALTRALKAELLATLEVADLGAEAILVPSGTDGEYAALQIARRRTAERLVNIVIAPEETGSGVLDAARGWHFATETPSGAAVVKGAPLAGIAAEGISAPSVAIRAADGTPRPPAEIDAEVAARADQAIAAGARCLVHLLDVSKTGLSAPGPAVLEALCARHGERLAVVVDACQMRPAERLRGHLARGWMVLLTGSKFAMGPAFAGALLLPRRARRGRRARPAAGRLRPVLRSRRVAGWLARSHRGAARDAEPRAPAALAGGALGDAGAARGARPAARADRRASSARRSRQRSRPRPSSSRCPPPASRRRSSRSPCCARARRSRSPSCAASGACCARI